MLIPWRVNLERDKTVHDNTLRIQTPPKNRIEGSNPIFRIGM